MNTPALPDPASPASGAVEVLGASAEEVKAGVAPARARAQRDLISLETEVADARAELERQRAEMEADFARKKAELESRIAPLRTELEQLKEVAWTVDLYLGRDETVELLADGAPAPADTPLTIRQNVLAADEESLVLLDADGIDANNIDSFFDWIVADPAHRNRILPDERCVVAIVPTRRSRNYGNAVANAAMDAANSQTYWLLRNGERLYLMTTDFQAVDRILPLESEFVKFFHHRPFGAPAGPMVPGSAAWIAAEKAADSRRRHFMRAMLILQGIVDRTVVFHPLPEGGLNLMSLESQNSGKVLIINESDRVLTDGRETYFQWRKRLNAKLRPGLRVVLACPQEEFEVHPRNASHPPLKTPLNITGRHPDGGFRISYDRTDEVWEKYEEPVPNEPGYVYKRERLRPAKGKASIRVQAGDDHVLPFDLAETADMEYYLNSRAARTDYIHMAPVLRAALAARRAEEEAEAPFREALVSTVMAAHSLDEAQARKIVAKACTVFKTGSAWGRALHTDEPAASAGVLKEAAALVAARDNTARAGTALAAARSVFGKDLLAVTMNRQGVFHAYAPANDLSGIHHGTAGYLREVSLGSTGRAGKRREWVALTPRSLNTRTFTYTCEAWDSWVHADPSIHLTGPELDAIVEKLLSAARADGHRPAVAVVRAASSYGDHIERDVILYSLNPASTDTVPKGAGIKTATWSRGADGKVATTIKHGGWNERWHGYSRGFGSASVPWDESPGWPGYKRPYRVWRDDAVLEEIAAAEKAEQEARQVQDAEARRKADRRQAMLRQVQRKWTEHHLREARARFVEDFATNDEDLWNHHKGTLRLPPLPREMAQAVNRAPVDSGPVRLSDLGEGSLAALLETHPWMGDVVMDPAPAAG